MDHTPVVFILTLSSLSSASAVKATSIQEGLYTERQISDKYRILWRILKEENEIEVVMVAKGTGYVGLGWRPGDADKTCQRWPRLGGDYGEAEGEAESEAEAEAEAEAEDADAEIESDISRESVEDEDDAGGVNRRRVEKSVDISIGYVRTSVSTGQRRKRRQADEEDDGGVSGACACVKFTEPSVFLDLALSELLECKIAPRVLE